MTATTKPAPPDWERIESDYRAGVLSTREIATARGISHTAINKRAKAQGWTRDLQAKIHAKAEALVSRRAVSTEVSTGNASGTNHLTVSAVAAILYGKGRGQSDTPLAVKGVCKLRTLLATQRHGVSLAHRLQDPLPWLPSRWLPRR